MIELRRAHLRLGAVIGQVRTLCQQAAANQGIRIDFTLP